uniref:Glycine cleavage system H protein n=1 Tax=Graphocephala atropunctata TaxID=36148 RepID=A0A1B6MJC8_9HEMI
MVCLRLGYRALHRVLPSNYNLYPCLYNGTTSCKTVKSIRLLSTSIIRSQSQTDRLYTPKHEWILVNGNVGIVGISHYAQDALGDVVYAQLPESGTKIEKHDEVGALESVKAASELYSPVSGTILEKNTEVEDMPALINQSCYDKGWLFKVELSNPDELKELLDEAKYKEFLKADQESHS